MSSVVNRYKNKVRRCLNPREDNGFRHDCGYCVVCTSKKSNDYVFKLQQEYKHHRFCGFVSLTYQDKYLHFTDYDEILDIPVSSINPKDWTRFINSLTHYIKKRYPDDNFTYAMKAEYGGLDGASHRPHFHFMYFTNSVHVHEQMMSLCSKRWCEKLGKDSKGRCKYEMRGKIDIRRSDGTQEIRYPNQKSKRYQITGKPFLGLMNYLATDIMSKNSQKNWIYRPDSECEKTSEKGYIFVNDWCDLYGLQRIYHHASRGIGMCYLTPEVLRFHRSDPENNNYVCIQKPDEINGYYVHRIPKNLKDKIYGKSKANPTRIRQILDKRAKLSEMYEEEFQNEVHQIAKELEDIRRYQDATRFDVEVLRVYNERHRSSRLAEIISNTRKASSGHYY